MKSLELKVPPALVFAVFMAAMWLLSKLLPGVKLSSVVRYSSLLFFLCTGAVFGLWGLISFWKNNTTIHPNEPKQSTALVTNGIYKVTRNPMYVGLLFFLIGWAFFLANMYSFLLIIGFVLYITNYQIKPEERALEKLFGQEYLAYKNEVRRWL